MRDGHRIDNVHTPKWASAPWVKGLGFCVCVAPGVADLTYRVRWGEVLKTPKLWSSVRRGGHVPFCAQREMGRALSGLEHAQGQVFCTHYFRSEGGIA